MESLTVGWWKGSENKTKQNKKWKSAINQFAGQATDWKRSFSIICLSNFLPKHTEHIYLFIFQKEDY